MSADNWTTCPKCKLATQQKYEKALKDAQDKYGVIPSDEYRALIEKAEKPLVFDETMREDYEIGVWEEDFSVSYTCLCTKCKFQFAFERTIKNIAAIEATESEE